MYNRTLIVDEFRINKWMPKSSKTTTYHNPHGTWCKASENLYDSMRKPQKTILLVGLSDVDLYATIFSTMGFLWQHFQNQYHPLLRWLPHLQKHATFLTPSSNWTQFESVKTNPPSTQKPATHTHFSIRTTLCLSLPTLWQVWNSLSLWLYRLNLGTAEQLQRKPPWKRPSFVLCSTRSWARSPPCVRSERSLHPDRGLWPPIPSSTKRAVMLSPPRPPDSAKSGEKHLKKGANAGDFLQIHGQHGGKTEKTCDFSLIWGFWRLPSRKEL